MAYVFERTHSLSLSSNSLPLPSRLQIKITSLEFVMFFHTVVMTVFFLQLYRMKKFSYHPSLLGTLPERISALAHFSTEFSFLVLKQPSRFVIRYIYEVHRFCLTIFLFFNYCLIKGSFVWDQSGIRIIGIMRVSVCVGAILIPEYLDFYSAILL